MGRFKKEGYTNSLGVLVLNSVALIPRILIITYACQFSRDVLLFILFNHFPLADR